MWRKLEEAIDESSDCNAIALFLLSHGHMEFGHWSNWYIMGLDGTHLHISDIMNHLNAKFLGKPKLVFVQACAGGRIVFPI